MIIEERTFDNVYAMLIDELFVAGKSSTSRKGKVLTELHDQMFVIQEPINCMAVRRDMSYTYLQKEFAFYMSGSNSLKDAVACSPFWEQCSDDGETVNSNYGKLLFHDINERGFTQFEHAVNCLKNSKGSKKAVMTLYDKENAFISNDNPCTMYLRARIDHDDCLHMTAVMRSSDIYYGLPYDVPFFVFVQLAMMHQLADTYPALSLGTYTHMANSLHYYGYKESELKKALAKAPMIEQYQEADEVYSLLLDEYLHIAKSLADKLDVFMEEAWASAGDSGCYKKKVGCVLVLDNEIIAYGHGDIANHRLRELCETKYPANPGTVCRRDDEDDVWYETGCPSVHAEHRALNNLVQTGRKVDFSKVIAYVTHGPCDACLKMLDLVGIRTLYYDIPYKTDYSHWPDVEVKQIRNPSNREEGKHGTARTDNV